MKLTTNKQTLSEEPQSEKLKEESKKSLSPSLVGIVVGGLLGLCLSLALCYFIFDLQVTQKQQVQLEDYSRQKAELTAQNLSSHFNTLMDKVSFFANQSLLRNAIAKQDVEAMSAVKQSIKRQIKDIVAISFFKIGEAKLNTEAFPPLRFSEMENIKSAEMGQFVEPEAVNIDGRWLLHVTVPVESEDGLGVDGVVWVSTDINSLKSILETDNIRFGKVALYQNFGRNSRVLVQSVGEGNLPVHHVAQLKQSDSPWEIEFTASEKLLLLTHIDTMFVYIVMLIVSVACLLIFIFIGFMIGRRIDTAKSRLHMEGNILAASSGQMGDGYVDPMYQTKSFLNVEIDKADESLLGLEDDDDNLGGTDAADESLSLDDDVFDLDENKNEIDDSAFPKEVFRAYDIRGIAGDQITKEFALALGKALGSEVIDQRENTLVVARDARTHSPELTEWLIRGVLSTGCNVLNIGTVPTPLMYFTIETMDEVSSGVMVTASHNGAKFNGFKMVMNGIARSEDDIQSVRTRMVRSHFIQGQGQEHHHDIVATYIDTIFSDVALAGEMTVVIDAGNGVAGKVAPQLFEELGCRVIPLFCDLDGTFPNHAPDPSKEENLQHLIAKVKDTQADIGIALDGDGDRLTVVSPLGKIIWADRLLMLFAKDIISRSPGADVIFDVKSTRHLNSCVASYGGRPIMWKTGHSLMKQKMVETGAVVGAEYSGHIFIKDRWFGFDDGMYAAARLLEVLSLQGEDIDTAFEEFPESVSTPEIRIPVAHDDKFDIIEKLKAEGDFGEGRLTLLDGIRADFSHGWGLVRASNTGDELTMRFEADDEDALHQLKSLFVKELRKIDNSIEVDWKQ